MSDYIQNGSFPDKITWKRIVNRSVDEKQSQFWLNRIESDSNFSRFRYIHKSVSFPNFWITAQTFHDIRNSYFITKLITSIPNSTEDACCVCKKDFTDVYLHACCACICTFQNRDLWWNMIIENYQLKLFCELSEYEDEIIFQILLGRIPVTEFYDNNEYGEFVKLCHVHVIQCVAEYWKSVNGMSAS